MKKQYIKPMIAVEYYELTQSIATCAIKIGLTDSQCVLKDPDAPNSMKDFAAIGWFNEQPGCGAIPEGMEDENGICYHTNVNAAFSS